jgi:hypothetical protein
MFALKFPVRIPPPRLAERTLLPAALVALLGVLLVVQFVLPSAVELPEASIARPLRLLPIDVRRVLPDPEVLLRPLFAPGRRENPVAGTADPMAPLEGARAVGLITGRGGARAFLQAPDGKVTAVSLGGRYRDWRLVRIGPDKLLFIRGAESATIAITASVPPVAAQADATETPEEEPQ